MPSQKLGIDSPRSAIRLSAGAGHGAAPGGRQDAQGNPDQERHTQGGERQLKRHRECGPNLGQDRAPGDQRAAEIASRDSGQPLDVTGRHGPIEAEELPQLRPARRVPDVGAQQDVDHVAGHQV